MVRPQVGVAKRHLVDGAKGYGPGRLRWGGAKVGSRIGILHAREGQEAASIQMRPADQHCPQMAGEIGRGQHDDILATQCFPRSGVKEGRGGVGEAPNRVNRHARHVQQRRRVRFGFFGFGELLQGLADIRQVVDHRHRGVVVEQFAQLVGEGRVGDLEPARSAQQFAVVLLRELNERPDGEGRVGAVGVGFRNDPVESCPRAAPEGAAQPVGLAEVLGRYPRRQADQAALPDFVAANAKAFESVGVKTGGVHEGKSCHGRAHERHPSQACTVGQGSWHALGNRKGPSDVLIPGPSSWPPSDLSFLVSVL